MTAVMSLENPCDSAVSYQQPSTGATINMGSQVWNMIVDPAGTLATLTVNAPQAVHDGHLISIWFSQAITALTIGGQGGQSVVNGQSAATAGQTIRAIFKLSNTTWYFGN